MTAEALIGAVSSAGTALGILWLTQRRAAADGARRDERERMQRQEDRIERDRERHYDRRAESYHAFLAEAELTLTLLDDRANDAANELGVAAGAIVARWDSPTLRSPWRSVRLYGSEEVRHHAGALVSDATNWDSDGSIWQERRKRAWGHLKDLEKAMRDDLATSEPA